MQQDRREGASGRTAMRAKHGRIWIMAKAFASQGDMSEKKISFTEVGEGLWAFDELRRGPSRRQVGPRRNIHRSGSASDSYP